MTADGAKKRILVVDDEPGLRTMLTFELNFLGYESVTAENAEQALALLRESKYDLMITDVRMPGSMDGIELVEFFRKEDPGLKAVFITGFTLEDRLDAALKNPLSRCLKKPFDLNELSSVMSALLR